MNRFICFLRSVLLVAAGVVVGPAWAAELPTPAEFSWRADLTMPAGSGLARLSLPPEAMAHLKSQDARDVRVFNGEGQSVAFALSRSPLAAATVQAAVHTQAYLAYSLFVSAKGAPVAKDAVRVQIDSPGGQGSVWVRFGDSSNAGTTTSTAQPLQSALFDLRSEKRSIEALSLQAKLPVNALINFSLAASTDLAQWEPVVLRGPLFRFEGAGAPSSSVLELVRPLAVEGRYLRLSWEGQQEVQVSSLTGVVAKTAAAPSRVRIALAPGVLEGNTRLDWPLGFATPLATVHLTTARDNTLIPIRILGRDDVAQPWRPLVQSVIYRLNAAGNESANPPVALGQASVRWLRVEAMNGMSLVGQEIVAHAEFEPIELIVLATGKAPFELAIGRAATSPSAVDASVLASVMKGAVSDLPSATLSNFRIARDTSASAGLTRWLPAGVQQKSLALWAVLLVAVAVLAAVAFGLLRQVSGGPAKPAPLAGVPLGAASASEVKAGD